MRFSQILIVTFLLSSFSYGQSVRLEKMKQLNFLVGNWKGVSKSFKNGKVVSEVKATEKIAFGLEGHILTIDLNSESLQLHTVIYYDEKDKVYYYNPFYKTGAAKYKAEFKDNKLVVNPTKTKRFVFGLDAFGNFVEYGEIYKDGKWLTYFKDVFSKD